MIRVGFVLAYDDRWLGGINYFRNLLTAISKLPDRKIEPVILAGSKMSIQRLSGFPLVEVVRSRLLDPYTIPWTLRKVWHLCFNHDWLLERLLAKHHIDILSHSGHLGKHAHFPAIGWIPDFQHRHIPEYFNAWQFHQRETGFSNLLKYCRVVIVSSADAQADLSAFYPLYTWRSRVLQFVASIDNQINYPSLNELKGKYGIHDTSYFHLPNQFYVHKNHRVVINALRILKQQGTRVTVLATGSTSDYRHPDYYKSLMAYVKECGLEEEFRVIGIVPYPDLITLMKHSIGLINPSFFEGWSTTVEESKAIGKRIILSDIPVHREQAPTRGVYFNPHNPQELAATMKQQSDIWSFDEDVECMTQAIAGMPARMEIFAKTYQDIVLGLS